MCYFTIGKLLFCRVSPWRTFQKLVLIRFPIFMTLFNVQHKIEVLQDGFKKCWRWRWSSNPLGTIPFYLQFEFHHERVTEGFLSHVWWWHESDLTSLCGLSYFTGSLSYQNINMIDLKSELIIRMIYKILNRLDRKKKKVRKSI